MNRIARKQAASSMPKVMFHPNDWATQQRHQLARRKVPKKYQKKPVRPAAVPEAFFGARSSACTPMSITGP